MKAIKPVSLILLSFLVLAACTRAPVEQPESTPQPAHPDSPAVTANARESVCQIVLTQAVKYNPALTLETLVNAPRDPGSAGGDGVTRAEFFVILSRAFGGLPEPAGGNAIMFPEPVVFDDVPEWAREDIETVAAARILLEPLPLHEQITDEEIADLLGTVHTLLGTSLKDDFFSAANRDYLENFSFPPGDYYDSSFSYVEGKIDSAIDELISEIVSGTWENDTPGQKMADLYNNYLNFEARNGEGTAPIQKYLDEITGAGTLDELSEALFTVAEETAFDVFASFAVVTDLHDSNATITSFLPFSLLPKFVFDDANTAAKEIYLSHMELALQEAGFDGSFAADAALNTFEFEKQLSEASMDMQQMQDAEATYNIFTLGMLQEIVPGLDLGKLLAVYGYEIPERIVVQDFALCKEFGLLYVEENLDLLKDAATLGLVRKTADYLTTGLEGIADSFVQSISGGGQSEADPEYTALALIRDNFGGYLGSMYVEKYFREETKADIENMCAQFIDVYRRRIQGLGWMSTETKERAMRKLDTMDVRIGYPERYDTEFQDAAIIRSFEDGGSYFENIVSLKLESRYKNARAQSMPVDKDLWPTGTYTVNAQYTPINNSITFPAGFLQPPFYDPDAKAETNYGAIGAIIAHEITHAFDNNGSKYDEYGNVNNWWTSDDSGAFSQLLEPMVDVYGYECYPGIFNDGTLTLSENIADLGGVSCALEIVNTFDDPDYDAFFRGFANAFRGVSTREYMKLISASDIHSLSKARVNVTLANFDEFYATYDISPDDYMYIHPDNRVGIW